jgi:hypothetical protein
VTPNALGILTTRKDLLTLLHTKFELTSGLQKSCKAYRGQVFLISASEAAAGSRLNGLCSNRRILLEKWYVALSQGFSSKRLSP